MTKLDELQARFRAKLPGRARLIAQIAEEEACAGTEISLDDANAWREAHKLAGTAGSFGYDRVSEVARSLEKLLRVRSAEKEGAIESAFTELDTVIREASTPPRSRRDSVPRLGLAGDSETTVQCVELLTNELIEVVPLSLSATRAAPGYGDLDAVLVDATEHKAANGEVGQSPLRFIRELRASHRGTAIAVILLVDDSSLETRIAAAHAGADLILAVPLSRSGLIEAIRMVTTKHLERPVVLAIDDDPDALELIQCAMQSRFQVVTLNDPGQLLSALQEHSPDALVLDYDMPHFNGLQLCASVRLSRENNQIPIIFVTNRIDRESRLAAFAAGCDDYLHKSEVRKELISRVSSRLQRTAGLRAAAETDSLTGLALRRVFIPALESRISEATRRGTPLALCILDIDRFKRVNDLHGHLVGDRVLADLGALIQQRFRREDLRCRWGGEEFAIAFPGETAETIESVLNALLAEFSNHTFQGQSEQFNVSFSAGVSCLGHDGMSMDQLMAVADDRLYMAKSAGRARVVASGPWEVLASHGGE